MANMAGAGHIPQIRKKDENGEETGEIDKRGMQEMMQHAFGVAQETTSTCKSRRNRRKDDIVVVRF